MRQSAWTSILALAFVLGSSSSGARAAIREDQVLVVYNSALPDGSALLASYLAAHPGIPASNVCDLNRATMPATNISYADFVSFIRTPIRDHLLAPGAPEPADIVAIALLRPIPHRILDTDNASIGDNPSLMGPELEAGDITCASVDSELVLLWQNLEFGEAGGSMDSKSDNLIDNPYHGVMLPSGSFTRTTITQQKTFSLQEGIVWTPSGSGGARLRVGDLYLVCRIDGTTLADAQAMLARAQDIVVPRAGVRIVLDEYNLAVRADIDDDPLFSASDPFNAGDDYEETRNLLVANGWDVRYDDTFDFISAGEETTPLIAYASYGENHSLSGAGEDPPGVGTYIDDFNLAPGAIFNSIESYNGRALNGAATRFGQEQAADFITAGGTFAIGHVWEPFSFAVPDNEYLLLAMLVSRLSFAEAAYISLPVLSWQHVVLGDPLGRYEQYGDCDGDEDVDLVDFAELQRCVIDGDGLPECHCADMNGDGTVDAGDYANWQPLLAGPQ